MDALHAHPMSLLGAWQFDGDILFRLALATLLGSVVGLERALRDKPAGFRTNILICLGACVFTIASQAVTGAVVDQSRIAAQIVSGVGFLGAGAIIRDIKGVVGLTTAASIWSIAAIGMACGFGEVFLAVAGTGFMVLVLWVFPLISDVIEFGRDVEDYRLGTQKSGERFDEVEGLFARHQLRVTLRDCYEENGELVFIIKAIGSRADHQRFRREMLLRDDWRLREP